MLPGPVPLWLRCSNSNSGPSSDVPSWQTSSRRGTMPSGLASWLTALPLNVSCPSVPKIQLPQSFAEPADVPTPVAEMVAPLVHVTTSAS
eukprot:4525434-Prymnesium_polylepis.1